MKKRTKKVMSMLLVAALTAGISISGTMAYLTSEDSDVNVMTLGNVKIEQHEYERVVDENGDWIADSDYKATFDGITYTPDKLQEFTQAKPAYPAVYQEGSLKWDDRNGNQSPDNVAGAHQQPWGQVGAPDSNQLFDSSVKNVIDKFVFVENTGKSDAYYRTIVAVECPEGLDPELIHINDTANTRFTKTEPFYAVIDGVQYVLYGYIYNPILTPNEVSRPSFLQVFLDPAATNEDCALFGDTWEILVVSQAVQAAGFADAMTALETAFGEVNAVKVQEWFGDIVQVSSVDELTNAIANATEPTTIVLANGDYAINQISIGTGKDITIIGSADAVVEGQFKVAGKLTLQGITVDDPDEAVSGEVSQYSKSAIALVNTGDVVCNNVTFNQDMDGSTAITAWWSTGDGANIECYNCTFNSNGQRPIRSDACVTVENCTFNDPYRYAVQMTSKASTMAEDAEAYVKFNNNTINAGSKSGKTVVYGVQLEGGYGCANLTINGSGNAINVGDNGKTGTMYYCECGNVDHETIIWDTEAEPVHERQE